MKTTTLPSINFLASTAFERLSRLAGICFTSGNVKRLASTLALVALPAGNALSDDVSSKQLKLIELYTSHGCSSCPPADELLGKLLSEDEHLLALEFHVDYWDNLVHGSDGNFVDPFSDASYSRRQRTYNVAELQGRPGVYTPQAIVNGRYAAVGTNRKHISRALATPVEQSLDIRITEGPTPDTLSVDITGSAGQLDALVGTDISVAHYLDEATTLITGGENRHKSLTNHHIVRSMTRLGEVTVGAAMTFSIEKPAGDAGCVVLVQEDALTPVFAAQGCP
ncbi:MAG: DUF1223 domain-containing protein [Granulosicoccus sp.]